MKKIRTLLVSILMIILGGAGVVFSACGENNDNMTLSLSTSHVEIYLGENDNTATLYATVENASDKSVSANYDSASIQVSVKSPSSDGVSEITVKALRQCQDVEVRIEGATKSTVFTVTAIQPVTAITPNQSTYAISYSFQDGGSLTFTNDMFTIVPEGTNQTQLNYRLVNEIEGVSIENKTLTIQPGLSEIPSQIAVEVVSAHRENVRATISVTIVKAIDVSNIQIVDEAGASLDSVEISRTNTESTTATIFVRVPYSITNQQLSITPVLAYNDKGIVLDNLLSHRVESGAYYEYAFDFTVTPESTAVGSDRVWFVLSYEQYPEFKYSTANETNGVVTINVVDEIRDISVTSDGAIVDVENSIDIFTTYVSGIVQGYALTFSAIPSTATSSPLSLNISAVDLNYLIVRDSKGEVIEFTNNKYVFNSGDTFYFIARPGFVLDETVSVIVKSEKENIDVQKTLTFVLKEGVTSLGFVNSTLDGIESTRQYYLDTNEHSTYQVQVALAPSSIDLTTLNSVEIYSTSDAFTVGQIAKTDQTLNGANIYTIEILSNKEGSGELVISFISGQIIRANVTVINSLSDVSIDIDSSFAISTALGDYTYDDDGLNYVALKNGQSLPLTFNGNADIESVSFSFVDYVYDSTVDDVYDENSGYVNFGKNKPNDENFSNNTSQVISANYLRSLRYISPIAVGKVWVRAIFTGKQIVDDNGENVYSDIQISRYLLVEIYNPIISIEIDSKEVSLYPADELGQENVQLSEQIVTFTVNRGNSLPTYNLLEIEGMTSVGDGLYQYFVPGGKINFEIEKINDYQFLVRALTRNDDGTDDIGATEFESAIINFVSRDLNLDRNEYSISLTVTMKKPQLVEEVIIGNVGEDGIYLEAPNLTNDISLTSFKLAVSVLPSDALNKGVVYRFIPDSGTLSTILTISEDGFITTQGTVGGSGKIRVIPKDSVFVDNNGHEYYRDGYVYAEVDIFVADGRTRETALRITSLSEITNSDLHYILLSGDTYSSSNQLFGEFNGGLYGSANEGSQNVVTITFSGNSNNLFGTLSEKAIISDLAIVGNVNASSMLVDTNYGTIKNVTVSVYSQGEVITPSSVNSAGDAGGIAQKNYGLIENVTFAGNITSTGEDSVVGGIVAVNDGEIINSKVLFYNFEGNTTTNIDGHIVGALVGELTGHGKIQSSYAYSFSKDPISTSQNVGAIVGKISSKDVSIDKCFADIGSFGEFADVTEEDLTSIISDSYTITTNIDDIDTNINYVFTYYMTNLLGRTITGTYSSSATQSYPDVAMDTSKAIWWQQDKSVNHGFPYIYNLQPPVAITGKQLAELTITQSRLSLAENGGEVVMFFYRANGVNLTSREQQLMSVVNTISYGDLFGTYSASGIVVTSSNPSVVVTSTNSLTIKNTGTTTLTITSLYDYSVGAKQINVTVIYYTSPLVLTYNGQTLGDYSKINIRTRVNETLISSLESSIILVDRAIPLAQNNYVIRFVQSEDEQNVGFILGSTLGTHTIVGDFNQDDIEILTYLYLDGLNQNNCDSIKLYTQKTITLHKIYGPISIESSVNRATISASDQLVTNVEVTSDTRYLEDLENIELVIETYDSNLQLINSDDVLYDVTLKNETENENNTTTRIYQVTIRLNTKLTQFDSKYTVVFSTDSPSEYDDVRATLELTVLDQEVLRVDINHYSQRSGASSETGVSLYNYYPNNVSSPNTTGLLDIMVYPSYAKYTHITVTSEPQNGIALSFLNMRKKGQGYSVNLANTFAYITNGIQVYKVDSESEVARYYVRVKVPEGVQVDTVYTIYVNVMNGDEVMYTLPYSLIIVPQEKAGITVDGESSIYAIRGETITADIIWDQTQSIDSITAFVLPSSTDPGSDNSADTMVAGDVSLPSSVSDSDREEYATSYYKASINIEIGENASNFRVRVDTSRTINGVKETVYSYLVVYVIDFELDFSNTHIANEEGTDIATGDQYFYHTLKFNFGGRYVKNEDGSISASEQAYNEFTQNNYYVSGDYIVNIDGNKNNSLLYNLYYVNGKVYTPVLNNSGEITSPSDTIVRFEQTDNDIRFIGTQNGTQQMLLQMRVQMPDLSIRTYNYFFSIVISDPTSDDSPSQISNAEEFLNALNGESEEDYILTKDIHLYDYTPAQDTSKLRSLDGNGHQIVIVSFNYDNTQSQIDLALFNTVSSNTTLKNLRVNVFHLNTISITSAYTNTVNIAPIAITNNGIITNCEVVSFRDLTNEIAPAVTGLSLTTDSTIGVSAITAGFVVTNNGIITNSRVGGESVVEYDSNGDLINTGIISPQTHFLSPFVISSFGEIAGFVYSNTSSGHIVSSYASNIRIINNSNIDYTTITAGFVVENAGLISASYAKGVKRESTDIHATLYGIETSGISAGFVYENSGEINNSYSNLTLTNQNNNPGRNSAGFVYRNTESGVVEKSLSLSRIVGTTTTQMNFAGVDDFGNYQNLGEITNSYYYDEVSLSDSSVFIESAYGEGAEYISSITDEDYLYGFSFANKTTEDENDGIWFMTSVGPELVSANQISVSLRYASNADQSTRPIFAYVDEYRYGSKNNPILIRSAEEFAKVFSGTDNSSASRYVNTSSREIFGSYRLINDIDLSELITDSNNTYTLASSSMTLTGKYKDEGNQGSIGKFDGNGLTISGLALSDPDGEAVNFGMFASVTDGAIVQNVNLVLGSTNAGGDVFGVEASGVEYVGALSGTVENSTVVNVSLVSAYDNASNVTVRGKNVVGGLIGRVIGDSYIFNLSVQDISVTASMNPTNYISNSYISYNTYNRTSDILNAYISYAGGVVGVLDAYTSASINTTVYAEQQISSDGNAIMLKTLGTNIISGGTVGGVTGYIGPLTVLQDALYELSYVDSQNYSRQGIYSYNGFAGGIVGYNAGYIRQVRSEHEKSWQIGDDDPNDDGDESIEANIKNYYANYPNNDDIDRGNTQLFMTEGYTPIAIGGLVGLQVSGKIEKSYSKLNVINTRTQNSQNGGVYAGGIIGLSEMSSNPNTYVETNIIEVYASGDVQSQYASGIVGLARASMRLDKVNAINYWGDWLLGGEGQANAIIRVDDSLVDINNIDTTYTSSISFNRENIKFTDASETLTPSAQQYINDVSGGGIITSLPSFVDTITGAGDDGENYDVYFTGNGWDKSSWSRDDNELYPHIVFGYLGGIHYIRTEEDIEDMRTAGENDIFVIDPDMTDKRHQGYPEDVRYVVITRAITPINAFSGELRGLDNRYEYGFLFKNTAKQTRALFTNTLGATFSNFTIAFENTTFESAANTSQNAILVANSTNTTFADLTFRGVKANINTSTSQFGLVTGMARGSTSFRNIKIQESDISFKASTSQDNNSGNLLSTSLYVGLVFGESYLTTGSISSIAIKQSHIIFTDAQNNQNNSLYVGLVAGRLASSTGNESQISIDGSTNDQDEFGVFESGIKFNSDSTDSKIYGLRLGMLFGYVDNAIVSSNNLDIELSAEDDVMFIDSYVGGLIGYSQNITLDEINVDVLMNVTTANSSIGGIVGYSQNIVFNENTSIDVSNNNVPDVGAGINVINARGISEDNGNNIGSVFGSLTNLNLVNNNKHIIQSLVDITVQGNGHYDYIGGIVGSLTNGTLYGAESYGEIILEQTSGENNYVIYVGGIAGRATNNSSIENCYSFGDIKHIVINDETQDYSNVSLIFSGIVATVSSSSVALRNNISTGNFYPSYKKSTSQNKTEITKSVSINLASLTYGGLVGVVNDNLTIEKNISIATLFNRYDRDISGTYEVNALVGSGTESVTIDNENYYAHVATLCTDSLGNNVSYENILSGIAGNTTLYDNIEVIIDLDEEDELYSQILYNGETAGTKLNPSNSQERASVIDDEQTWYVKLSDNTDGGVHQLTALTNTVVIGDGALLTFSNTNINKDSKSSLSPIQSIDKNSSVSGIVVVASFVIGQDSSGVASYNTLPVAGLTYQNEGIIYSCNVSRSNSIFNNLDSDSTNALSGNQQKLVGTIDAGKGAVAGLVGENSGLIKDSFVSLNISTEYEDGGNNPSYVGKQEENETGEAQDVAVAGLVGTNDGMVVNSYSSGNIDAPNAVSEKGSNLYVYLLAAGKVYDSYTNMRVVYENDISGNNMRLKYHIFAFDSNNDATYVKKSYYDQIAAEFLVQGSGSGVNTEDLSTNYIGTLPDQDHQIGTFNYDSQYAYGYGSFSGGAYQSIEYMRHDTGNGKQSSPYQIPNLGKLKQLENSPTEKTYYNLVNDINASYVSTSSLLKWTSIKNIKNIVLDGYDTLTPVMDITNEGLNDFQGNTHKISNLTTRGGGLFDTTTSSELKNLVIENLFIDINANDYIVGLLANKTESTNINNIKITSINPDIYRNKKLEYNAYYYGNVVGELGSGSKLSECQLITTDNKDNNNIIELNLGITVSSFIYGGIVGHVTGEATVEDCRIDKELMISFSSVPTATSTIIAGGVVGLLENGTVENSYLSNNMYVLSDILYADESQNTTYSNTSINLYTGGIVGGAGYLISQADSTVIGNNGTGKIINSGLFGTSSVFAGNPYNISKSYVGGISGFGGNISNSYVRAENIIGNAKYNYTFEGESTNYIHEDEQGATHPRIFRDNGNGGFDVYKKLGYAKVSQEAHVAGIANSYDRVSYVSTSTSNIYGGLSARKATAYYDVDTLSMASKILGVVGLSETAMSLMIAAAFVSKIPILGWKVAIGLMATIAGITVVASVYILTTEVNINEYYIDGSGYNVLPTNEKSSYYSLSYKRADWTKINIFAFGGDPVSATVELPLGVPIPNDTATSALDAFMNDGVDEWMGLQKYNNEFIYNNYLNDNNVTNLYVYDVYSHSIGNAKDGETKGGTQNVAWRSDLYQVHENLIENSSKTLYSFNDVAMFDEDYQYIYDVSGSVITKLSKAEGVSNTYGKFGDDWITVDGDYIPSTSPEVASTPSIDLFDQNTTASGTDQSATATIKVNSVEDYRATVNLVNKILSYQKYEAVVNSNEFNDLRLNNSEKFKSLVDAIQISGGITIELNFSNSAGTSFGTQVDGFGESEESPFSGKITSSSYKKAEINGFLINNTGAAIGLVNYGKNVDISNLDLTYHTQQSAIANTDKSMGGLIGTLVDGGNVNISNTEVSLIVKDYIQGSQSSTYTLNAGGLVGSAKNSTLTIQNTDIELSTDLTASGSLDQSELTGVGGLIGRTENTNVNISDIVSVDLYGEGIVSTSSNNIFGGAIGYMLDSNISTPDGGSSQLDITGNIDVENTSGNSVYVGGLIGYYNNNEGQVIKLNDISIGLSKIEVTAGISEVTTYAGGVIGYSKQNTSLPISKDTNIKVGTENQRLIITSGINGTKFSTKAYADNYIGNRGSGYDYDGKVSVNTSVLAMADPSYYFDSSDVEDITQKPKLINSRQIIGVIGKQTSVTTEGGDSQTGSQADSKTGNQNIESNSIITYMKVDAYEYETQVSRKMDSYVNGENRVIYNYQKNIYIIIINGSVLEDSYKGTQDVHSIQETVYRLSINGYRYDDSTISDIVTDTSLEFVTAHQLFTTSSIYKTYLDNSAPIPMTSRNDNFAINNITILSIDQYNKFSAGSITTQSVPFYTIVTEQNGQYINLNNTEIVDSTITTSPDIDQGILDGIVDENGKIDESALGDLDLGIDDDIIGEDGNLKEEISKQMKFKFIKHIDKNDTEYAELIKNMGPGWYLVYSTLENKNVVKPIYIEKDHVIYNSQISSITNSISWDIKDDNENILDLDDIKSTSSTIFNINLNDGNKLEIDKSTPTVLYEGSLNMFVTTNGVINIDGLTHSDRRYKTIFISFNNGFATEQNMSGTQYQEYIFLVDSKDNVYYLGNISYISSSKINFEVGVSRNDMFFPERQNKGQNEGQNEGPINIITYQNNLLSLNEIQNINDSGINLSDIVNLTFDVINSTTTYYIDATSQGTISNIYRRSDIITTTYSISLNSIIAEGFNNISVDFNYNVSSENHNGEAFIVNDDEVIEIKQDNQTVTYKHVRANVYKMSGTQQIALNAVVLEKTSKQSSGSNDQTQTIIYVFDYDGSGHLTGFTLYDETDFVLSEDGTYYIIKEDASGDKYDGYGISSNIVSVDTTDENDFGVSYEIYNGATTITFENNGQNGYVQLKGTNYTFKYENNILTVYTDKESYIFEFVDGNFVKTQHKFTLTLTEGTYTITESYSDASKVTILVEFNAITNSIEIADSDGTFHTVANNNKQSPTQVINNIEYLSKNWWTDDVNLATKGYIEVHTSKNEEMPVAIIERTTLHSLTYKVLTTSDNSDKTEAHLYFDNNSNVILIFIKQNGDYKLLKSGEDVYNDLGYKLDLDTMILSLKKNSAGIMTLLVDNPVYDISNGFWLNSSGTNIANSDYSSNTLNYKWYLYNDTHVNGEKKSHTKIEWTYDGEDIVLELDFALSLTDENPGIKLIPFNGSYAIKIPQNHYYTLRGYKISGTVGEVLSQEGTYTSLGVSVPKGIYVLKNNATVTTDSGDITVNEYVYARHNTDENWYSGLGNKTETFEYTTDDGVSVSDTITRSAVTINTEDNIATFTETVEKTTVGEDGTEQKSTITYNWTFDASKEYMKFFKVEAFLGITIGYNRYSDEGYAWNINESSAFASTVIKLPITQISDEEYAILLLDVVFGEMNDQIIVEE